MITCDDYRCVVKNKDTLIQNIFNVNFLKLYTKFILSNNGNFKLTPLLNNNRRCQSK